MHSTNSFHNRLMLHHWVISQEVINTESWSAFQFLWICSAEFRYSFVFDQYVGKTHLVSSCKNQWIWLWWLNKQLKPLIENQLVTCREVEFTETYLIANPWHVNSNWSYSPEMAKLGCDLCDLDLWPLTKTLCMDVTLVRGDNSWKFHDDTMMGT